MHKHKEVCDMLTHSKPDRALIYVPCSLVKTSDILVTRILSSMQSTTSEGPELRTLPGDYCY